MNRMNRRKYYRNKDLPCSASCAGFTLLELSIVLIIISLISGGIIAGRSLMEASRVRRAIDDFQIYSSAFRQFRDKYEEVPGDISRATEIWGLAGGTGSDAACVLTDSSTLSNIQATCNGNGNGYVDSVIPCATFNEQWCYGERHRAWQHLSNAEMVNGRFTGRTTSPSAAESGASFLPGINAPASTLQSGVGFQFAGVGITSGHGCYYDTPQAVNTVFFGRPNQSVLKPSVLAEIDRKMDDGRPGTGLVTSVKSSCPWQPGCTTTDVAGTARYALGNNAPSCAFLMLSMPQ